MSNKLFNLDVPIIQAPMAGGVTTPELVAAVSNAGALGSLGAGYMTPDELRHAIKKIKSLTKKPFNVNLFIPEKSKSNDNPSSMKELLATLWSEMSNTPFEGAVPSTPSFEEQVSVILEEKVPIFSFTFGIPSSSLIERFKNLETLIYGTATTPEEAQKLEEAGVDAIVCQGQEAGGHRGNFSSYDPFYSLAPLLTLAQEKVKTPLIAAGGIMNGKSAAATFLLGAHAAQLGTAFLTTTESGASSTYKEALLKKPYLPTSITQAFTGKPARAIINSLMEKLNNHPILSYPAQHFLTQKLRNLAAQKKRSDLMSLWAGQSYPLCRSIDAASLVHQIAKELE
ncbi:MAG: nitronate monooxygenase [Chlamydiota bacterium]